LADQIHQLADDLWNIRGSFRIARLIDIGTQATLVRRRGGGFLLLDAYTLQGEVLDRVLALTDRGRAVEAVLNLHPFHTLHVRAVAALFPEARLYGTRRHVHKAPELRWEPMHTEDAELHERFAPDLAFTVPRGVDLVPANERVHFSSVLAVHRASRTLVVDDTLMYVRAPLVGGLRFHPTLKDALQPRADASSEFRAWSEELAALCAEVTQVCPAHIHLPKREDRPGVVSEQIRAAAAQVRGVLDAHEKRFRGP
jgi:hypothetical protein